MNNDWPLNPELDLVLERTIPVSVEKVWEAWTNPEHIKHWFAPRPYSIERCEIDLRPGGQFRTVMRAPDGQVHEDGAGCFLEVKPQRRLVWTDSLGPGYRPNPNPFMTAVVEMEPVECGTRYRATAIHGDAEIRKQHEEMGFHTGWGTALDQMVEFIQQKL
jgi:uncharacterized protein YndB with AHSA1/START domain